MGGDHSMYFDTVEQFKREVDLAQMVHHRDQSWEED